MKYAKIKKCDVANGPGVRVSLYVSGCNHHCKGCFNPETWDFNGGKEFTGETMNKIIANLNKYGIHRSLCILGGEPLCKQNLALTEFIINSDKAALPETKIYVWTGYILEDLILDENEHLKSVLNKINYLIDGPFIEEKRDLRLQMRGSSNQRIIRINQGIFELVDKI